MTTKSLKQLTNVLKSALADHVGEDDLNTALESHKGELTKLLNSSSGRSRKKKDPNAPKKWKTGYIFYCTENRAEVKEANPDFSATQITTELAKKWKSLTEKEKKKFEDMSQKDRVRYDDEMTGYEPPSDVETTKKSRKKEKTGPKRPTQAYIFFCKAQRDVVKQENPNMNGKNVTAELGARWKALTDEEKKPYVALGDEDKKRYEAEKSSAEPQTEASKKGKKKVEPEKKVEAKKVEPKKPEKKVESKKVEKKAEVKKPEPKKVVKEEKKSSTPGFDVFCDEARDEVETENPNWDEKKVDAELNKRWKKLKDSERQAYAEAEQDNEDELELDE